MATRQPIAINLSQETLAEMIGTTRSRVSFFMNQFRKKGYIDYNGKIEVHRSLLDAVLRDKPQIREDDSHRASRRFQSSDVAGCGVSLASNPVCLGSDSRIRGRIDRDDRKGRSGGCEFSAPMTTASMRPA